MLTTGKIMSMRNTLTTIIYKEKRVEAANVFVNLKKRYGYTGLKPKRGYK